MGDRDRETDPLTRKRKHVGPYALGRTLGQGAFGKVKLGTNIFTGDKVAVKIISYKNVKTKKEKTQIDREREILLALQHPNIVNLLKVVDDPKRDRCYMVFEYVAGGELFDYIVSHGRLSEADARKFMRQIVSAVEYCHSLLIIHRDLKPENLLLDSNLNIKISDFGLSNVMEPGKRFSTFCGSLHYACPEILRGEKYLGPGVDVWSMGIILYCLVVGRQPWDGSNAEEIINAILEEGLEVPQGISDNCVNLILSMLRVCEEDRISIAKMRYHSWIVEGYDGPPESYLPPQDPIVVIDPEIMDQLTEMGFIEDRDAAVEELVSSKKTQLVVTYNLLLSQKVKKIEEKRLRRERQEKEKQERLERERERLEKERIEREREEKEKEKEKEKEGRDKKEEKKDLREELKLNLNPIGKKSTPPPVYDKRKGGAALSPRKKKKPTLVITGKDGTPDKQLKKAATPDRKKKKNSLEFKGPSSPRKLQKSSLSSPIDRVTKRGRSTSLSNSNPPAIQFDAENDESSSDDFEKAFAALEAEKPLTHRETRERDREKEKEREKDRDKDKFHPIHQHQRVRSVSVSQHPARPVFALEDVATGKLPSPMKANRKSRAGAPKSPNTKRPSVLSTELFKPPEDTEESKLNEATNPTQLVPETTTTKPLETIAAELVKVLEKEGIKHKKLRDRYIYKCLKHEGGGSLQFEIEIVSFNKHANTRALEIKRTGGDVWVYKIVYETIVKQLKSNL